MSVTNASSQRLVNTIKASFVIIKRIEKQSVEAKSLNSSFIHSEYTSFAISCQVLFL